MALIIESGSRTVMKMTTPPTGWTKDTSFNDYALRVTTGSIANRTSGLNFSTVFKNYTNLTCTGPVSFTVNPTTLTSTQTALHTHAMGQGNVTTQPSFRTAGNPTQSPPTVVAAGVATPGQFAPEGGGGSHTHPTGTQTVSPGSPITQGGSPVSVDLSIKYVDVIIAIRS